MPKHLLLVDDEMHILRAAEFKLKRQGYQVQCAFDGEHAWETLQQATPDLVVSDLQMPRLNGLQLIQRMRKSEAFRDIPAILLTAKGLELSHDEIIAKYGVFEVMSKPFSPRDLCKRVQMALQQSEREAMACAGGRDLP